MSRRWWVLLLGIVSWVYGAGAQTNGPSLPRAIPTPKGMERSPGPWLDPADLTAWPNRVSHSNSDPWLARNHDRLKVMRPRVLLVNFSNEHSRAHLEDLARRVIACLAEASRYHGYENQAAPAFLQYEIFKLVDLRDSDRTKGESRLIPLKDRTATSGFNMDYNALFSEQFARLYGVVDPRNSRRFLRLDELVDGGYIHELWFFMSGSPENPHVGAFEEVEEKPVYDVGFGRMGNRFVQAGNGGDRGQAWTGRSLKIGCINASRGPGCFMESLSHGMEGLSRSGAIPYFTRYFREYGGFDLKERYGLPFDSLYATNRGQEKVSYPNPTTMLAPHGGRVFRVDNYVVAGGNVHFPPNARSDYDMDNPQPVMSTIRDWRIGSGRGGKDVARAFESSECHIYDKLAPDCMGPWLIYWRQNMPGLGNRQRDDQHRAMKNWWPFLFY